MSDELTKEDLDNLATAGVIDPEAVVGTEPDEDQVSSWAIPPDPEESAEEPEEEDDPEMWAPLYRMFPKRFHDKVALFIDLSETNQENLHRLKQIGANVDVSGVVLDELIETVAPTGTQANIDFRIRVAKKTGEFLANVEEQIQTEIRKQKILADQNASGLLLPNHPGVRPPGT